MSRAHPEPIMHLSESKSPIVIRDPFSKVDVGGNRLSLHRTQLGTQDRDLVLVLVDEFEVDVVGGPPEVLTTPFKLTYSSFNGDMSACLK